MTQIEGLQWPPLIRLHRSQWSTSRSRVVEKRRSRLREFDDHSVGLGSDEGDGTSSATQCDGHSLFAGQRSQCSPQIMNVEADVVQPFAVLVKPLSHGAGLKGLDDLQRRIARLEIDQTDEPIRRRPVAARRESEGGRELRHRHVGISNGDGDVINPTGYDHRGFLH